MGAVSGTLYSVFSTSGTLSTATVSTDKLYSVDNASFECDVDLNGITTNESADWEELLAGIKRARVSFGGVWNEAGSATALTYSEIMAIIIAGQASQRKFVFVPTALGVATPGWKFLAFFKNLKIDAATGQPCKFSGEANSTGPVVLFDS